MPEEAMVRLVAYQNLYGPITQERLDLVAARLGMDVVAPHLRKGKKTKISDHLMTWGEKKKQAQTPEEMLAAAREITAAFKQQEKAAKRRKEAAQQRREKQRAARQKQAPAGGSGRHGKPAHRRRSRPRPERR